MEPSQEKCSYISLVDKYLQSDRLSLKEKKKIKRAPFEEVKDMFSSSISFGTAGIRGIMGIGPNRMSIHLVRKATIGLVYYLYKHVKLSEYSGVCISFDNRYNSKEFAEASYQILNKAGINVFTFNLPHPTPELSFSCRHYKACAGIMITASHNPKQYNGWKVYDESGCQFVYEKIDNLIKEIDKLPSEIDTELDLVGLLNSNEVLSDNISLLKSVIDEHKQGQLRFVDEELDPIFIQKEVSCSVGSKLFNDNHRQTKIVFSPMCGANSIIGKKVLEGANYTVSTTPKQDYFDPAFKGTKSPNPEDSIAYEESIKYLTKLNKSLKGEDAKNKYKLILVCDPDGDRMGVCFLNKHNRPTLYTGNQVGALLINFLLNYYKENNLMPENPIMFESFVTSQLGHRIAEDFNVKVETVLTGFKYVGNKANNLGKYNYVFGYEESYGYLIYPFVRDKDSLQSMVLIADMVEYYAREGKSLDMVYSELQKKYGYYLTETYSVKASSTEQFDKMKEIISSMRKTPLREIDTYSVTKVIDYQDQIIHDFENNETVSFSDLPKTNCVKYILASKGWIAIRPSGTEPKAKIYVELVSKAKPKNKDECLRIYNYLKKKLLKN